MTAPRFTQETVSILKRAYCPVCDLDADGLPMQFWDQWTRQHLAIHEPGAGLVMWIYDHAVYFKLEAE